MPRTTFITMKEEDRLGLGVEADGVLWLAEARQMLDFNLKRLAHRARSGKLEGVRLEAGTLIVTPTAGEVPAAAEELNAEISDMYPLVEVPDLLRDVHEWTGFADFFTHVRTGDTPKNVSAMLADVLADATNLGRSEWRRIQGDQRSPDRLDAHFPRPIRDISCCASIYYRCTHPPSHIPAFGATARHLRQMANSFVRATEPQSAATFALRQ